MEGAFRANASTPVDRSLGERLQFRRAEEGRMEVKKGECERREAQAEMMR